MPKHDSPQWPLSEKWSGDIRKLKGLGSGTSGIVLEIDEKRVIKIGLNDEHIKIERRAYEILAQVKRSPHILYCFEFDNPEGLILERCVGTLRERLRSDQCDVDAPKCAVQAAKGLAFLHDNNIIQADLGCHNMLVDSNGIVKLCDFAGSSVDNLPSLINYEVWARIPFKNKGESTTTSDLFALGSAFYEMSTKKLPYDGKHRGEIQRLYEKQKFPPVEEVEDLGQIITKCWLQKYKSAHEVVDEIGIVQTPQVCRGGPMQSPSIKTILWRIIK